MPRKILLIQLRQLGDIILTTAALRELKRAWPDAQIDFLSHPMGRLILQDNPYLHRHITYDEKQAWYRSIAFVKSLRQERYDLVLDFMYNPRSALYAWATQAPRRLAFPNRRQMFFTEVVPQGKTVEYIVHEKFRYLRQLGIEPSDSGLDLPWFEGHLGPLRDFLEKEPAYREASLRVLISPTHRREERQWPVERYAQIADRLKVWGASVVWIWGPGEEDFVKAALAHCQEPMLLAPKTTFRELAAFMAQADLFIGNSNGPSHVAVSTGIPSLQVHGPTYARTWCPLTKRHRAVQAGANSADQRGPIRLIEVEELWQTLEDMRADVETAANLRRASGIRLDWTQVHKG